MIKFWMIIIYHLIITQTEGDGGGFGIKKNHQFPLLSSQFQDNPYRKKNLLSKNFLMIKISLPAASTLPCIQRLYWLF